jgi:hypothetical protein
LYESRKITQFEGPNLSEKTNAAGGGDLTSDQSYIRQMLFPRHHIALESFLIAGRQMIRP